MMARLIVGVEFYCDSVSVAPPGGNCGANWGADGCCGSKADVTRMNCDARFAPKSGLSTAVAEFPVVGSFECGG